MQTMYLYAVTDAGPQPLPVPAAADNFEDLYERLDMGVYSALRTFAHNKFLNLEAHLDRTDQSMRILGWRYRLDRERLRQALHDVCTSCPFPESRVRFDVLARPATRLGSSSRELIALMPFVPVPQSLYELGVSVDFAEQLVRSQPLAKTADFARKRRILQLEQNEVYERLLVDERHYILEGMVTNFYGVRAGALYTAGIGMLEGITRRIILGLASDLNIPVYFEPVHVSAIDQLDEAALSGSSRALLPVVRIAGHVIGSGRPGPVVQRLLAAYRDYVAREIRTAV